LLLRDAHRNRAGDASLPEDVKAMIYGGNAARIFHVD